MPDNVYQQMRAQFLSGRQQSVAAQQNANAGSQTANNTSFGNAGTVDMAKSLNSVTGPLRMLRESQSPELLLKLSEQHRKGNSE